jgi:hypothetical protein
MVGNDLQRLKEAYRRDGFVSGVEILTAAEAAEHRRALEWAESKIGPLHYKTKVHTILRSPLQLATTPTVLDIVERLIGPDVLLYNVTYIVKEADTPSHVSWHQDLTYWGLSHDDQVSMWLALSPATAESGCMRMIPGSQGRGRLDHDITGDRTNVLFQGQTVRDVDESNAVTCPLEPGEASFHHGWTLHASLPNKTSPSTFRPKVTSIRRRWPGKSSSKTVIETLPERLRTSLPPIIRMIWLCQRFCRESDWAIELEPPIRSPGLGANGRHIVHPVPIFRPSDSFRPATGVLPSCIKHRIDTCV